MKSASSSGNSNGSSNNKLAAEQSPKQPAKTMSPQESRKKSDHLNSSADSMTTKTTMNANDTNQLQPKCPKNLTSESTATKTTTTLPTGSNSNGNKAAKRERNKANKNNKNLPSGQKSGLSETADRHSSATSLKQSRSSNQKGSETSRSSSGGSVKNDISSSDKDTVAFLDKFAKRAEELTKDICETLERQSCHEIDEQPAEVSQLKDEVLKLSSMAGNLTITEDEPKSQQSSQSENGLGVQLAGEDASGNEQSQECNDSQPDSDGLPDEPMKTVKEHNYTLEKVDDDIDSKHNQHNSSQENGLKDLKTVSGPSQESENDSAVSKSDAELIKGLDSICTTNTTVGSYQNQQTPSASPKQQKAEQVKTTRQIDKSNTATNISTEEFDPLNMRLDPESKLIALKASLAKNFTGSPELFDQICRKLVSLSDDNAALTMNCERYRTENQKLSLVKGKLENLCRELQKSNNSIRIESLDLIKSEQTKAKEQTVKIQSTLSGVIKLFHENQQRNMTLRQENQELQNKLRALLEHCDNWSTGVDAALRKRDIENRLLKTELAKANLLRNEEKEKFLSEKQELLQIWSLMQEQQHKFEGQEAKLRSDLSSYASKYDECKAVISKGMNKFQTESKLMMKQIEKSRSDYKVLLSKYEGSNKRLSQLLVEKQSWDKQLKTANKKIETLEKLCRALRQRNGARSQADKGMADSLIDEAQIGNVVVATDEEEDNLNKQEQETIISNVTETIGSSKPDELVVEIAPKTDHEDLEKENKSASSSNQ